MPVHDSTTRAVERTIRAAAGELTRVIKGAYKSGAADRYYELRQTLLTLAKVRASFEIEFEELESRVSEPIGFRVEEDSEPDEGLEIETGPDVDTPEARGRRWQSRAQKRTRPTRSQSRIFRAGR